MVVKNNAIIAKIMSSFDENIGERSGNEELFELPDKLMATFPTSVFEQLDEKEQNRYIDALAALSFRLDPTQIDIEILDVLNEMEGFAVRSTETKKPIRFLSLAGAADTVMETHSRRRPPLPRFG